MNNAHSPKLRPLRPPLQGLQTITDRNVSKQISLIHSLYFGVLTNGNRYCVKKIAVRLAWEAVFVKQHFTKKWLTNGRALRMPLYYRIALGRLAGEPRLTILQPWPGLSAEPVWEPWAKPSPRNVLSVLILGNWWKRLIVFVCILYRVKTCESSVCVRLSIILLKVVIEYYEKQLRISFPKGLLQAILTHNAFVRWSI